MNNLLKIYIGYDAREDIAWQVCRDSLLRHATIKLDIQALKLSELQASGIYQRPQDTQGSTEFTISRFLTPTLAQTEGWSMFVDCDFVFTDDIAKILENLDPAYALYVVQHDYTPTFSIKMDGKNQHPYPRKNWSSLMLFNGNHPKVKALSADVVNNASPAFLHRFAWLEDDEIGSLSVDWNFLVGEYPPSPSLPKGIHYTNGGPWMNQWQNVDYANIWLEALMLLQKENNKAS